MNLTAAKPHALKVIEARPDGSGVFEIPIMGRGELDLTTIGGNGTLKVDDEMWGQIVENFGTYPGAVPVGMGAHVSFGERGGPQLGFVERVYARADSLWARIDATAELYEIVVVKRQMRGFSVELIRDLKHPSRSFQGWVLTGGVFTNRPASDVSYRVAASADAGVSMQINQPLAESEAQESKMEKVVSLAVHEAKVGEINAALTEAKGRVTALETQVASANEALRTAHAKNESLAADATKAETAQITATARANRAESEVKAQAEAIKTLQANVNELKLENEKITAEQTATRVRELVGKALQAGVAPAHFDGWEADPAAYVNATFASIDAFEKHVGILCGVAPKTVIRPQPSGHVPAKESDPETIELSADEKKKLEAVRRSLNLKVDFGTVSTEEEARERYLKSQAKSA